MWRGSGVEEKGVDKATGEVLVEVDPRYFRPTEVDALLGDASKARAKLGWRHKTSFDRAGDRNDGSGHGRDPKRARAAEPRGLRVRTGGKSI